MNSVPLVNCGLVRALAVRDVSPDPKLENGYFQVYNGNFDNL